MSIKCQAELFVTEDAESRSGEARLPAGDRCKRILVPYPVDKAYDYIVPDDLEVQVGDYVCVPVRGKEVPGIIWGDSEGDVALAKLKAVISKYPLKPMSKITRDFIDWVARYTVTPKGAVLKMALSVPAGLTPPKPATGYKLKIPSPRGERELSPKQQAVLDVLQDDIPRRAAEIAREAGCTPGVIKTMAKNGVLEETEIHNPAPCRKPDPHREGPSLSEGQGSAAEYICSLLSPPASGRESPEAAEGSKAPKPILLDGVTGAGKTEVYFEAVAEALKQDKQVLILLPEIALSNAFLERFKARFGCDPALWHSNLSPAQRRTTWRGVAEGHTKVVVGARSALFLPYQDLGFVVVDEEHDPAYKQEDGVIYHARDMAVTRAHLGKIPIVLVSATPSLETIHNAWNGRYDHLHLSDRYGGSRLPEITTIDMREDKPERGEFISPPLRHAVAETIQKGEQALLFLNRRGYAPLTLCRTCGHRMECPRCTAWLVEHKAAGKLQCHHCGFHMQTPKECPECGDTDSLNACGPGVERIHEEAKRYFPDARIMVLASDTAETNEQLRAMLDDIRAGKVDIIIGTQIIAKGHHFPNLTCVGVIDADLGLQGGELRAAERTYQLLHQVAGRAGREEALGRVYLQSFMPDHKIMQALSHSSNSLPCESGDLAREDKDPRLHEENGGLISGRDLFLAAEAQEREAANMPPYSRLVGIIIAGREESQVIDTAKALGRAAPEHNMQGPQIQTLGPAPAPFARLRGRYRYRLLVRAEKEINIQKTVATWVAGVKTPSTVRVYIDIDPQSFL